MRQQGVALVCLCPRLAQVPTLRHVQSFAQASTAALNVRSICLQGRGGQMKPFTTEGGRHWRRLHHPLPRAAWLTVEITLQVSVFEHVVTVETYCTDPLVVDAKLLGNRRRPRCIASAAAAKTCTVG